MATENTIYFLSYSHEDEKFVLDLAKKLQAAGAKLWLDQLDLVGGDRWDKAIEKALKKCGGMIVVLSPNSVDSQNVLNEVTYALNKRKRVVPILYQNSEIPLQLHCLHHIDFTTDYHGGFTKLLSTIVLDQIPEPPLEHRLYINLSPADKLTFILIPPGSVVHNGKTFTNNELFYLAERPISEFIWRSIMQKEGTPCAPNRAVTKVSYMQAEEFCKIANENIKSHQQLCSLYIPSRSQLEFVIYSSKAKWPGRLKEPFFTDEIPTQLGLRDLRGVVSQLCVDDSSFGIIGEPFDEPKQWNSLFQKRTGITDEGHDIGLRPALSFH